LYRVTVHAGILGGATCAPKAGAGEAQDAPVGAPARRAEAAARRECAVAVESLEDFEVLYERYFEFVWTNVRRLGVPASYVDDVTQEVFLVVHRRRAELEACTSLRAWIFGVVSRTSREQRRRIARKSPLARCVVPPVDPDATESKGALSDEVLAKAQATRLLQQLLEALDDDKREVFVLAELEQMTAPEIAEATGANLNTVYARLRAARREIEQSAARLRARDGWRLR
jgi:RNA polymerase sigma-70 factor (ECF subfamily)